MYIPFYPIFLKAIHLSTSGGSDLKDTVRGILKGFITNKLAKQINWLGRRGKRGFLTLNQAMVVRNMHFVHFLYS